MNLFLTAKAKLVCKHELGKVGIRVSQEFVTIGQDPVLVENDPEQRPVSGCPNIGATIKPCTSTLKVIRGYSNLVRINHRRVCLDTVTGLTDGTPPGTVRYIVRHPGQNFVSGER
ncbi:MAG: hypothetical protein ACOCUC_00380 [bacterium]